jgi:thioredoxin 1
VGNAFLFNTENFEAEVIKSPVPVLVDFTATWCGPCQKLAPIIEDLAAEYRGKAKIGKVDIDESGEIASRFGIMSVPTVIAFHGGAPIETMVGINSKVHYKAKLDEMIGS